MFDRALQNAQRQRDDIAAKINRAQQQIEEWRKEIAEIDSFLASWKRFAGEDEGAGESDVAVSEPLIAPVPEGGSAKRKRATRNSKKEDIANEAYRLIELAGHPLSRAELYDGLIEQGMVIEGVDPQMVLSTMLWRMKNKIVRLAKGGYWMADKPCKEENYFAAPDVDDILGSVDEQQPAGDSGDEDDSPINPSPNIIS